ncbi:MAG: hypothetical protein IAG10_06075, partial [Planctomycetaceae bacterium]|nr:hypothetical protein [Planctomycetaceae bacterium]
MLNESGQLLLKPGERLTLSSAFRAMDRYIRGGVGVGWTALVLCLLSGIPFAVLCWRKQRLFGASRSECFAWMLLVYSFGLVGWIAFVTHREWPRRRAAEVI